MLRDADSTLAAWLGSLLPRGIGIRFDAPCALWTSRVPDASFVSAFLLEIRREDRGLGSSWSDVRDANGRVVGRQPAVQHFSLTYLVTAWPGGGQSAADAHERALAEHELLGTVLGACSAYDAVPIAFVEGSLADCGVPTLVRCASAGGFTTVASRLWTGFGVAPRAHLELVLVAPLLPPMVTELAPAAREIVLDVARDRGAERSGEPSRPPASTRRWEKSRVNEADRSGADL